MGAGWGPLPRAPLGRVAKSDTVKKVYKLYWSTYIHTHTHQRHTRKYNYNVQGSLEQNLKNIGHTS